MPEKNSIVGLDCAAHVAMLYHKALVSGASRFSLELFSCSNCAVIA